MFHFGLYKEGLKRSAFVSAIFIAAMMLGAIFIPIANISSHMNAVRNGWAAGRIVIEGTDLNLLLILAMVAFAPILTLYLFSFLNKRNSSDFYHSIPHKREALYLSYLGAALTWLVGGIWLCAAVSLLIYTLAPVYVLINFTNVFLVTLGLTAASILVMAATLIAMGLTGSSFSNIVTALLILFLPRTIIHAFTQMVVSLAPVVSIESFGFLGNASHNIPFGWVLNFFERMSTMDHLFSEGLLYTSVLALLYLGLGLWLFKIRKSEAAQAPASNKIVQTAIRVALAFVVCIPAAAIITHAQAGGHFEFLPVVIVYTIALFVYFTYELITTKKLSSLARALPGLGILLLANIVFIAGVNVAQHSILNRQFHVDQIASVRVHTLNAWRWGGGPMPYEDLRIQQIRMEDDRLTELLIEALDKDIAALQDRSQNFWMGVVQASTFEFQTNSGSTVRRTIRLTEAHFEEFMQLLSEHETFRTAFLTLPEQPSEIFASTTLSEEALRDIYNTLRTEVLEVGCLSWNPVSGDNFAWSGLFMAHSISAVHLHPDAFSEEDPMILYGTLHVTGFVGRETYSSVYGITNRTPRAAERYLYHVNAENFDRAEQALQEALSQGNAWISIQGLNTPHPISQHFWPEERDIALMEALLETVQAQRGVPIDLEAPTLKLGLEAALDAGEWIWANFFFNTTCEEFLEHLAAVGVVHWGGG